MWESFDLASLLVGALSGAVTTLGVIVFAIVRAWRRNAATMARAREAAASMWTSKEQQHRN